MRWFGLLVALAACGRSGFSDVIGLGDADGVVVSGRGGKVIEDRRYDIAPTLARDGYAVAWFEFPPDDRTLGLRFATVGEDAEIQIASRLIEIVDVSPDMLRLYAGSESYLLLYRSAGQWVVLALDATGATLARRTDTTYGELQPDAVAVPGGFALVYTAASSRIAIQMLDHRGAPTTGGAAIEDLGGSQYDATIIAPGDRLSVAWTEAPMAGSVHARIATLDAAGALLAPSVALYPTGGGQGNPYLAHDGGDSMIAVWDAAGPPERAMRFGLDATARWSAPAVVYDDPRFHDTVDLAIAADGRFGVVWASGATTKLTNIELAVIDGNAATTPNVPAPTRLSDPDYEYCYPELARASASFGAAFAGEVRGSLSLFVAIVDDAP